VKTEEIIHELWAMQYALQLMGFKPEELVINGSVMLEGKPNVGIVLQAQGKTIGLPIDKTNDDKLPDKFKAFAETTGQDRAKLLAIWQRSKSKKSFKRIAQMLMYNGFVLPTVQQVAKQAEAAK
jgi:hypothetical protein